MCRKHMEDKIIKTITYFIHNCVTSLDLQTFSSTNVRTASTKLMGKLEKLKVATGYKNICCYNRQFN